MSTPTSGQARINYKRQQRAAFWNPPVTRTVWTGDRDQLGTPFQTRVVNWLRANGIDTNRVDADSPITTNGLTVTFARIRRNKNGRPYMDAHGLAVEQRTIPIRITFHDAALAEIRRLATTLEG